MRVLIEMQASVTALSSGECRQLKSEMPRQSYRKPEMREYSKIVENQKDSFRNASSIKMAK